MKNLLKIQNLKTSQDSKKICKIISSQEGIIAYGINLDKKEMQIVHDNSMISIEKIIEIIENEGFIGYFE